MNAFNTWHVNQNRNERNRFLPKWSVETIHYIWDRLKKMDNFHNIQFDLIKQYSISTATAQSWIEITRRIMKDVQNGLTFDEALERDKQRRTEMRRKKK